MPAESSHKLLSPKAARLPPARLATRNSKSSRSVYRGQAFRYLYSTIILTCRAHRIEALLPLSNPASPARSTRSYSYPAPMLDIDSPTSDLTLPAPSHSQILSTWVSSSLSSRSLSELATTSHESARQLMDASGPLMSWTALGGYCVAASIGIGIVAGEVVVARLLGIRRR